jgi:single-strand DNA-binding protein
MLNKFIGIGNLTKDPQYKELQNDKAVCILSIAINQGKDDKNPFYVDVQYWDNIAKNCSKYLKKGRQVFVEGKMAINSWNDKDGNKRQKFFCKGDAVRFLNADQSGSKKIKQDEQKQPEVNQQNEEPSYDEGLEDVPF